MSNADTRDGTEFDAWLKGMVGRHGEFTVLVILAEIGERRVAPLCSTYFHVLGDEVEWSEIAAMLAGSGHKWGGAAFFPTKAVPHGGPVDDRTARSRLRHSCSIRWPGANRLRQRHVHRSGFGRDVEVIGDRRRLVEEFQPSLGSPFEAGTDLDHRRARNARLAELDIELLRCDNHAADEELVEERTRLDGEPTDLAPMAACGRGSTLIDRTVSEGVERAEQAPNWRRQQAETVASLDNAAKASRRSAWTGWEGMSA